VPPIVTLSRRRGHVDVGSGNTLMFPLGEHTI
jgi:hypothetical protein